MQDMLLFFGTMLVCGAVFYVTGAPMRAWRRQVAGLQARVMPHTVLESGSDVSLRRKAVSEHRVVAFLARPLPQMAKLEQRLARLGIRISAQQYMLRRIFWMLLIMLSVTLLLRQSLLLGVSLGVLLGVWLPMKLLLRRIHKDNKAFLRLFPDALDLIVRGLRSGLPVSESIGLVASEVPDPVRGIFATIANTMKLGVPLEEALHDTARRLDLTEFNFFTTSITLQRETGGNLSEILNNLSEVLRGRYLMGMKIRAMSSEARASAMIIGALPFLVITAVGVLSPAYLRPLWEDPRGNMAAFTAAGMMITGLWVMNRMTKFEI